MLFCYQKESAEGKQLIMGLEKSNVWWHIFNVYNLDFYVLVLNKKLTLRI